MPKTLTDADFRTLFQAAPQLYLVLDTDLYIVGVSEAYLRATMTEREDIVGRPIFEIFPDNPDELDATGNLNLRQSLETVIKQGVKNTMAVQKYDIRKPACKGGSYEVRYWSPVNSPVFDEKGNLDFIIHQVEDVTDYVNHGRSGKEADRQTEGYAKRLDRMEREIVLRAQDIQMRTLELERVNEELRVARDQAIDSSKFKSAFLANMSHEIRTPMNGILGMTEILLRRDLPDHLREYVETIRDAGNSLLSVINSILDLSKMEAGKLTLQIVQFQPVKLVESVAELLVSSWHQQPVTIVPYIDPAIPEFVQGDAGRLRQILLNLAGNAIKFSDGAPVEISAKLESQKDEDVVVKFSVTDTGIGLTEAEIASLFKPFVQSDSALTKNYGGTGLGLSISKHLVSLMAGEMGVISKRNEGSTFWFTVKLKSKIVKSRDQESKKAKPEKASLAGARALIVDDEPYLRAALDQYMSAWGLEVQNVAGPRDTVKELKAAVTDGKPYSLALIPLLRPGLNGVELTRAIRAEADLQAIKLIMLTSSDKEGMLEQAQSLGFDTYLTKPIKQSQLYNCLAFLLAEITPQQEQDCPAGTDCNFFVKGESELERTTESNDLLILVVEDHPINQQVAKLILQTMGIKTVIADSGAAAIDSIAHNDFSLVFMDVQMPLMNGFETTRCIRALQKGRSKHLPIIAMTAHVTEGSREECLAAGMDDYMSKPITQSEVQKVLKKWLHSQSVN